MRYVWLALMLGLIAGCGRSGSVPDGAYLRTEFAGGYLSNRLFVFQNGQVAGDVGGDLEHFDFAKHRQVSPTWIGTYERHGDTLKIVWADGTVQEGPIRIDSSGEGFDFYGYGHAPIKPIDDAGRVQGRYYGGASYGGISTAYDITFNGNGQYVSNQAASVRSTSDGSEVSGGSHGGDRGTYAIRGNVLTLNGSGGSQSVQLYQVPTSGTGPIELLIMDGTVLTRDGD
ncbi:hypothetical protein C7S18_17225 [Ahniella affigens]|uniref:Uncharacterized protein n=1 Tax=Ahniella affigens TaxID=2021234 RepID=A0A2P1PVK7_9GAMM|nr:hypothetical protein [Ahniella affigens]AVP98814.1 hypothetical protein C7S18_17225 [Ahniella affigens]